METPPLPRPMVPLQHTTHAPRLPPLSRVAEVTVPLVAGAAFDTASDDAAPADDSRAPTASLSGVVEGTVPPSVPLFPLQERAPWPAPPPM